MPLPNQPQQPQVTTAAPRVALEQIDIRTLSKDKIRELFRTGRLPTAESIVEEIFVRATKSGSTDIHFEPVEGELRVRFGHEGVLKRVVSLPPDMTENLMSVLKTRGMLNQFEKKKPQEGRFSAAYHGEQYDFRLSIIPVLNGERAEIRLLHKSQRVTHSSYLMFFSFC